MSSFQPFESQSENDAQKAEEIKRQYAVVRKRSYFVAAIMCVGAFLYMSDNPRFLAPDLKWIVGVIVLSTLAYGIYNNRCPACHKPIRAQGKVKHCSQCGVQLSD